MTLAPTATLRPRYSAVMAAVFGLAVCGWGGYHLWRVVELASGRGQRLTLAFLAMFAVLAWNWALAMADSPRRVAGPVQAEQLARLRVLVAVPAYNEDPAALEASVRSVLEGTRRPSRIHVVDDGSVTDYGDLPTTLAAEAAALGVELLWTRTDNQGKRRAQALAMSAAPDADVFVTVDSDSLLDAHALEEVLIPLQDPTTASVAGVVVALNNRQNLLTRLVDLYYVAGQLTERSALSRMGSVMVNSGPLAAYRADVVRPRLADYVNETFFGRRVEFSDDSMLTTYAFLHGGRTVQQHSAVVFSLMPERPGHHLRQFLRWMRGSTIRSFWRFRYLPLDSYAYWAHFAKWTQTLVAGAVLVLVLRNGSLIQPDVLPFVVLIPLAVGYAHATRYLVIRRSDETLGSQLLTLSLAPLAVLWAFTVLRAVRWYGVATCWRTGWGTRAEGVEVALQASRREDAAAVRRPALTGVAP